MVRSRRLLHVGLGGAAAVAATTLALSPAGAATAYPTLHVAQTVTASPIGPLQFSVHHGTVLYSDSFTATLNQVGVAKPLATRTGKGADLSGVDTNWAGDTAYGSSDANHKDTRLTILHSDGGRVRASLSTYEATHNPDQINTYGVVGTVSSCAAKALAKVTGLPASYTGIKDSHPYAVAALPDGSWAVADAGGNDIVKVDATGHVSTISVLPPVPVTITAAIAKEAHLPSCVVGVVYKFEPVPTDVEVSPTDGHLYTSTLPGGAGTGYGAVYKIRHNGTAVQVVGGFPSATNLAFDSSGDIFVADLTAGTLWETSPCGCNKTAVFKAPGLAAVEVSHDNKVYVSTAPAALEESDDPSAPAPTGPPPHGSILLLSA